MADERLKVVAVRKDGDGDLCGFKMNDGSTYDFEGAKNLIHEGKLDLICTTGNNGTEVIRSYPDGDESNNLSNLPEF